MPSSASSCWQEIFNILVRIFCKKTAIKSGGFLLFPGEILASTYQNKAKVQRVQFAIHSKTVCFWQSPGKIVKLKGMFWYMLATAVTIPFSKHVQKESFSICITMTTIYFFHTSSEYNASCGVFGHTPSQVAFYQMQMASLAPLTQLRKNLHKSNENNSHYA